MRKDQKCRRKGEMKDEDEMIKRPWRSENKQWRFGSRNMEC